MALSHGLAKAGTPPDELKTSATVTFQPGEGITKIALTVEGRVPGIDAAAFEEAAQGAKENCPVSKALAGVPEITLDASLACVDAEYPCGGMAADTSTPGSTSSSAPTRRRRSACPTPPSTTTTARRRRSGGG